MRLNARILCIGLCVLGTALLGNAQAAVQGPGWYNAAHDPVDPDRARAYYRSQQAPGNARPRSLVEGAESVLIQAQAARVSPFSDDIQNLARALQHDPRRIYEFVRNNIEYSPYFGYLKGPGLTLLERSGNDFDQAALTIELLRASGYTANFVYGQMSIPNFWAVDQRDMQHWLGVGGPFPSVIMDILGNGGIPADVDLLTTTLDRVWVQAVIDGQSHEFDPAFKPQAEAAGIDLVTASGYDRSDILAAAAGETGDDYVRNLNDAALRTTLTQYTGNLVGYVRTNLPNADMREIVGGRAIVPEHVTALPTDVGFSVVALETWDAVPSTYVHTVRIQHGNIDNTLALPDIGGYKLALNYAQADAVTAAAPEATATTTLAEPTMEGTQTTSQLPAVLAYPVGATAADSTSLVLDVQPVIEPTPLTGETIVIGDQPAAAAPTESIGQPQAQAIAEPQAAAVQPTIDFGRISSAFAAADWPTYTRTLSNTGSATLPITTSLSSNGDDRAYQIKIGNGAWTYGGSSSTWNLAPGTQRTIYIRLNPTGQTRGTKTATFNLVTDYGWRIQTLQFPLTGVVAQAPNITIPAGTTDVIAFLGTPEDSTVTLRNNGSYRVYIDEAMTLGGTNPGRFALLSGAGAGYVAAGASRVIGWQYRATARGTHSATIPIPFTYDQLNYTYTIPLNGQTGLEPRLSNSTGPNFGTTYLGNPVEGEAFLVNEGTLPLVITSITKIGTNPGRFTLLSGTGTGSLAAGATRTIGVQYLGTPLGSHSADIRVGFTYDGLSLYIDLPLRGETVEMPLAQLWLDDAQIAAETAAPTGTTWRNMIVTVDHPYAGDSGTYADQTSTYELKRGGTYVLVSDFGASRHGQLLEGSQRRLAGYRAQGLADDSREVLTESLHIIGQTWMKQTALQDNLLAELRDVSRIAHHRFGIAAQEASYYVDVKTQLFSAISRAGDPADEDATFRAGMFLGSAMEHGVLEQLQAALRPAASTIKLLHLANSQGLRIYQVNAGNYAAIRPLLANYSTADLDAFQAEVDSGAVLMLPADGQLTIQEWRGTGYVVYNDDPQTGYRGFGMVIGGGYFGGYAVSPGFADFNMIYTDFSCEIVPVWEVFTHMSLDPVDMLSGAFVHEHTDLELGGKEPNGLRFHRYYSSDNVTEQGPLGFGWTHNYDVYVRTHSDVESGLALRQPVDAAALIVASLATLDLVSDSEPNIKNWTTAALTNQWAMEQLLENAATVRMGGKALTYIRLPDGSFNPPPGVTTRLTRTNGLFQLEERFGTVLSFNVDDKLATWTDIDGNAMAFTYQGSDLKTVRDSVGRTLTFNYTGGQLTNVTDSTGRHVDFSYDTAGNPTHFRDAADKLWQMGYDGEHRIATLTDPLGTQTIANVYDGLGRVMTQTAPRQGGTLATYNLYFTDFEAIEETPLGGSTTYFYDDKGRTIAIEDALGNRTATAYDGQNHVVARTDARGNTTQYVYDGNQNLLRTIDALGHETMNGYDAQYRLTSVTDALDHARTYDYDAEHHLTRLTDAENNASTATYRDDGRVETSTDARDTVASFTYDAMGNPDTSRVGTHPAVDEDYDAIGRRTALTDQAGAVTQFVYDERNLITSRTDPLGATTINSYDDAGRLLSTTDRNNDTVSSTYTPSGKVNAITFPDATSVQYGYDVHDRLRTMTDPLGTTSNIYDLAGRLTSSTDANGFTVGYGYDANGNVTSITYPGDRTVSYAYDVLNRLTTVTTWLDQTATYSYDAAGRLTQRTNFNGSVAVYIYDAANRLTSLINRTSSGTVLSSHTFTLDGNGNRTQEIRDEPLPPSGLTNTDTALSYNATRNRLLTASDDTFAHDAEGQLTDKSGTAYDFDYAHRLVAVGGTTFQYDGAGNRLRATRNGQMTKYVYDAAGNLLAEADQNNAITRYYIHGGGLLGFIEGNTTYSYHYDAIGSTLAITDQSQEIVNAYAYTPYGKRVNSQETKAQPFQYVGQLGVMTEANDLYYMRARYYDASIGRFISEDPIGFEGGLNLYAYVGGNPSMMSDPSGKLAFLWHGGITFAAALETGHGWGSFGIAWDAMAADFTEFNGVHSQNTANSNIHGMAIPGQSVEDAMLGHSSFISSQLSAGNLGYAAHAVQDPYSASHAGFQEYNSNMSISEWGMHLLQDTFPSPSRISGAYNATVNMFNSVNTSYATGGWK